MDSGFRRNDDTGDGRSTARCRALGDQRPLRQPAGSEAACHFFYLPR
jgi:hypothetical protein